MNESGQIKEFASEADAVAAGFKMQLTAQEHTAVIHLQEAERPAALAWLRYESERLKLGRRPSVYERAAFKAGWAAKP